MKLQEILAKPNATVIDVRESFEFFFGHLRGSTNIPLGSIPEHVAELKKINGPIVLVCRSGNRSGQAAAFLQAKGLKRVYNGGAWQDLKGLQPA